MPQRKRVSQRHRPKYINVRPERAPLLPPRLEVWCHDRAIFVGYREPQFFAALEELLDPGTCYRQEMTDVITVAGDGENRLRAFEIASQMYHEINWVDRGHPFGAASKASLYVTASRFVEKRDHDQYAAFLARWGLRP